MSMIITQEDVARRIMMRGNCDGISCRGLAGRWNQGVKCIFNEGNDDGCECGDDIASEARAWMDERGIPFYRFVDDTVPTGSVSYCDENLRLADCQDKSYPKGEMQ